MTESTGSSCKTDGIRVEVNPAFLPEHSDPGEDRFVFSYRIRITNDSEQQVQLLTRHWIIIDGDGVRHDVEGDGVVGEQPTLHPGEFFEYASWCPLRTSWGTMEGSFGMIGGEGDSLDVQVARFYLVASAPNEAFDEQHVTS